VKSYFRIQEQALEKLDVVAETGDEDAMNLATGQTLPEVGDAALGLPGISGGQDRLRTQQYGAQPRLRIPKTR
jgi:hypothetical protein